MQTLRMRRELPDDAPAIRQVLQRAFDRDAEAELVEALRMEDALLLSAVAEVQGKVVAHVAYSPLRVGADFAGAALAPVAVHPDYQDEGIGSALIRWSLTQCREEGVRWVLVLGSPDYYRRFGFETAPTALLCPFPAPRECFMGLSLQPGSLEALQGPACYRPEFAGV